jgi:hypothetical protein
MLNNVVRVQSEENMNEKVSGEKKRRRVERREERKERNNVGGKQI